MAIGSTMAAILAVTAMAGTAAAGIVSSQAGKKSAAPAPIPKIDSAKETIDKSKGQASEALRQRQRAAKRSQSIFSSPLGIAGEAATTRKKLLGE